MSDSWTRSITYLDTVAGCSGADYKRGVRFALDLRPGQTVLDVGCGPGTDLGDLVTRGGTVIGVDRDPVMVLEARDRHPHADVRECDAHALPLADGTVDRVRVDRMLHQVDDPRQVLAEVRRVLKPGGIAVVAQPDWDTLVVDPGDVEVNRALTRYIGASIQRHSTVGRAVPRIGAEVGFEVLDVTTTAPVFRDHAEAEMVLGLGRNAIRAAQAGLIDEKAARRWVSELETGPFLATFTIFTVVLQA
ncbi:methyltransferase domain-containing protein [Lentzea tibetensis]|uniref:Methyltransferase domain-containing protein n=1 Tax=Lentzea tibetensis TaxID=2591470 RepID=A0A563EU08_9PSEU|nr:methyltransferase domain-containing protein [Lentzea tibetensis]TWP51207.1 methyltransferase domain-containing protein [Lentzea tibetensis]